MPNMRAKEIGTVNLLFFLATEAARLRLNIQVRQFHLRREFKPGDMESLREHITAFEELGFEIAGTLLVVRSSRRGPPQFADDLDDLLREIRICIANGRRAGRSKNARSAKKWVQTDATRLLRRAADHCDKLAVNAKKVIKTVVGGVNRDPTRNNGAVPGRRSLRGLYPKSRSAK